MVNIPPILSLILLMASGVMTLEILMTASFCLASILYVPFFVLLDILPLLVKAVAGQFLLLFLLYPRWRALGISYYLLNLWLTLKLMIRMKTNYETVYSSIGLMSCVFFLELPLFWDGGKLPSFLASCDLLVRVFANAVRWQESHLAISYPRLDFSVLVSLTTIDPTSSWFEIVELPIVT